ncbi:FAD-binding protein [Collinsella provencensis]|uniref:FAD-binding protein n=1 Tax=Collinsella provencensis TaxID=1937461 RepID=UPI001F416421|nr:FAD-binding protein [Collinsella provencensis]
MRSKTSFDQQAPSVPRDFDVLVVGTGIAGIVAAIEAAQTGARVAIACSGNLFGGSSFYPGTWGLGLIGPQNEADEDDLIETILSIGGGVANPDLVQSFVRGILPSIAWLENELGVQLKRPSDEHASDSTYIPCFDHKLRLWRGIERDVFVSAAQREIERLDIAVFEQCELAQLVKNDCQAVAEEAPAEEPVTGAILYQQKRDSFVQINAMASILAAGGTSGIFARKLTSNDVLSSVHGIALDAGCTLTNIEFMQMMPGLVAPAYGVVFNEKTFRYVRFREDAKTPSHGDASPAECNPSSTQRVPADILPCNPQDLENLLEARSGHGPFTARLRDETVDLAIDAAGNEGLSLSYAFPQHDIPEFVQAFAQWLKGTYGIDPSDTLHVAMFAHASNGGIRIDVNTATGVPGLFACGELTGGMHGADRLGGLSSANGLVFGRRAGANAAEYARFHAGNKAAMHGTDVNLPVATIHLPAETPAFTDVRAKELTAKLQNTMSTYAMINRTEAGLSAALDVIGTLERELCCAKEMRTNDVTELRSQAGNAPAPQGQADNAPAPQGQTDNTPVPQRQVDDTPSPHPQTRSIRAPRELMNGIRLRSQLALARSMLEAMQTRKESLGSHYRADYPPDRSCPQGR